MYISSSRRAYLAPESEIIVLEEESNFMDSLRDKSFSFGDRNGVEEGGDL
jgi:hypothetical protein